jgi:hypothetical protein
MVIAKTAAKVVYACTKEVEIANLMKDNEYIKKDNAEFHDFFFGNGKPGFLRDMTEMQLYMKSIISDMPDIRKQLEQLIVNKNLEEELKKERDSKDKDKKVSKAAMYGRAIMVIGILCTVLLSTLSLIKSSSNASARANTIVTSPNAVGQAVEAGRTLEIPASEMKKQKEKNTKKEVESINQ